MGATQGKDTHKKIYYGSTRGVSTRISNRQESRLPQRYQLVLLKRENPTSEQVNKLWQINAVTVNTWLDCYQAPAKPGLQMKFSRGAKPVIEKTITWSRYARQLSKKGRG